LAVREENINAEGIQLNVLGVVLLCGAGVDRAVNSFSLKDFSVLSMVERRTLREDHYGTEFVLQSTGTRSR
jgi:hypothetical protein